MYVGEGEPKLTPVGDGWYVGDPKGWRIKHRLVCGKTVLLTQVEYNECEMWGEIEFCLHHCPDPETVGGVNGCTAFQKFMDDWEKEFESE